LEGTSLKIWKNFHQVRREIWKRKLAKETYKSYAVEYVIQKMVLIRHSNKPSSYVKIIVVRGTGPFSRDMSGL
jgi:hypothetical protein